MGRSKEGLPVFAGNTQLNRTHTRGNVLLRPWRMLVLFGPSITLDRTVRHCSSFLGWSEEWSTQQQVSEERIDIDFRGISERIVLFHIAFLRSLRTPEFVVVRNCQIWLQAQYSMERIMFHSLARVGRAWRTDSKCSLGKKVS